MMMRRLLARDEYHRIMAVPSRLRRLRCYGGRALAYRLCAARVSDILADALEHASFDMLAILLSPPHILYAWLELLRPPFSSEIDDVVASELETYFRFMAASRDASRRSLAHAELSALLLADELAPPPNAISEMTHKPLIHFAAGCRIY